MDARPEVLVDMELCALDALRMDGRAVTPEDLRRRYGFDQADVEAFADKAIAAAQRIFDRDDGAPAAHAASAGAAGALPVRRR